MRGILAGCLAGSDFIGCSACGISFLRGRDVPQKSPKTDGTEVFAAKGSFHHEKYGDFMGFQQQNWGLTMKNAKNSHFSNRQSCADGLPADLQKTMDQREVDGATWVDWWPVGGSGGYLGGP